MEVLKELRDLTDRELWLRLKHTKNVDEINKIKDELVNRVIIEGIIHLCKTKYAYNHKRNIKFVPL